VARLIQLPSHKPRAAVWAVFTPSSDSGLGINPVRQMMASATSHALGPAARSVVRRLPRIHAKSGSRHANLGDLVSQPNSTASGRENNAATTIAGDGMSSA